ncbi:hypothetical protein [Virgibacillus chiguensis]|uniref:Uncharacterized protein n=1 Tax=Virgibacillus chiguensis TaxID=411959 RepID=A0A1M5X6X7_9BACI|nr:hypothetical protein [Virgibacillus chiguensis]SHH95402.1 hypothetical protein SAMN05421807_1224 [Virgibacillus chiguensis]
MIPANVQVNINEKAVKEFIESKLQEQISQRLLLVDINKLAELTCMSVRYLEEEILCDPRIKVYERRKNRKRWWIAEPTFKAIEEIVSEW